MSTLVGPIESARTHLHAHTYKNTTITRSSSVFFLSLSDARVSSRRPKESRKSNQCRGGELKWISIESAKGADEGVPTWERISGVCSSLKVPRETQAKIRSNSEKREMKASPPTIPVCRKTTGRTVSLRKHDLSLHNNKDFGKAEIVRPSLSPRGRHSSPRLPRRVIIKVNLLD